MKRVNIRHEVNYSELYIPIDFIGLTQKHEVKNGTICYSDTWQSWVIVGHPTIDMICIDAPYTAGDIYTTESKGKQSRFNGMAVSSVSIKHNVWCLSFNEYWKH